jgi:hypothetical protein
MRYTANTALEELASVGDAVIAYNPRYSVTGWIVRAADNPALGAGTLETIVGGCDATPELAARNYLRAIIDNATRAYV